MNKPSRSFPRPLSDLLGATLDRRAEGAGLRLGRNPVALGRHRRARDRRLERADEDQLAARATDEETPEPATLVLRVEGPAALEIQHLSAVILERVNRFFGWQAIGRIALRQAPLRRPRARTGARRRPTRPPPRGSPKALPDIEDDALRERARPARRRHQTKVRARPGLGGAARHCHNRPVQLGQSAQKRTVPRSSPCPINRREFCQRTAAVMLAAHRCSAPSRSPSRRPRRRRHRSRWPN